jgi:hypothetical protein
MTGLGFTLNIEIGKILSTHPTLLVCPERRPFRKEIGRWGFLIYK